jgi:HD-GYP domain-containing protein (c-di-GMP phosphodiesterase class II)
MSQRYVRVKLKHLNIGDPLTESIYNSAGDLLLRRGRMITTDHQQQILMKQGYINKRDDDLEHFAQRKVSAVPKVGGSFRSRSDHLEDIFMLLSQWLNRLFHIFNLSQKQEKVDFSYQVLQLALDVQLQCTQRPDTLLAALQMDHDNHYGLVHALHCAAICEVMARGEHITQLERLAMIAGALTHDFGIIRLQEELHQQAEKPSDAQWELIHQHPLTGETLLREQGIDDPVWLALVRHHHERLDGSGYPDACEADQLSVPVRIMSIADTYTAVTRPTAFRKENTVNSALKILYTEGEFKLDRSLVGRFIKRIGIYPCGSLVRLSNHEVAVVTEQQQELKRPKVTTLVATTGNTLIKPQPRKLQADGLEIIGVEPFSRFRALQPTMESLWGAYL